MNQVRLIWSVAEEFLTLSPSACLANCMFTLLIISCTSGTVGTEQDIIQPSKTPETAPPYILCVGPSPGSSYPESKGCEYWGDLPTIRDRNVCVALDARVINSTLEDPETAYDDIPLESIELLLNDKPINIPENARELPNGNIALPKEKIPHYALGVPVPENGPVPIHFCWNWELASGTYLAELIIYPDVGDPLSYTWDFEAE